MSYRELEREMPEILRPVYWHLVGLLPTPVDKEARTRQRDAIFRLIDKAALVGELAERSRVMALDIPTADECTCDAAYTDRGLVAPDCAYHEYEDLFLKLRGMQHVEFTDHYTVVERIDYNTGETTRSITFEGTTTP